MDSSVEADRLPAMWGRATLATEESRTTMKVAVMTATAMAQGLAEGTQCACVADAGGAAVLTRAVRDGARLWRVRAWARNSLRFDAHLEPASRTKCARSGKGLVVSWGMELAIRIRIEALPEGLFLATSDELSGLVAQGRTVAEALDIARDVARKLIEARRERR